MDIIKYIRRIGVVKFVLGALVTLFILLFLFRKKIADHRVTKAKLEFFKRMTHTQPGEWDDEFKQIVDSMIIHPNDTIHLE